MTSDTMLIVYLKETFINEFEDSAEEPVSEPSNEDQGNIEAAAAIKGPDNLYPYDKATYTIDNTLNGT